MAVSASHTAPQIHPRPGPPLMAETDLSGDVRPWSGDQRDDPAIIRSKVLAPVVRSATLARGRLLGWLDAHADDRLVLVSGEAGFGKTTLLADWARRFPGRVLWYRLDASDAEWPTFLSYLIAAIREESPSFGISTEKLLAHIGSLGTTLDQALGSFLSELGPELMGRCILIVDDVHHVEAREEIRLILTRLLARAPEELTVVLSGRGRADAGLAGLVAHGIAAELVTEDLRFTSSETRALFAETYGNAIDADLLPLVDARTEGWAASLQLLQTSIARSGPAEVRDFIRTMGGTDAPIYAYLAEEVLARQTPTVRRVLVAASILDRVWLPLAVAALAGDDALPEDAITRALEHADDSGLMSRTAAGSPSRRFHPLLREFLHRHLVAESAPADLAAMHRRVAVAAESIHWPTAAHHYIEAGETSEAMRVIAESSVHALGTGAWGPALLLVDRMPDVEPPVPVLVIRARGRVAQGDAAAALAMLEPLDIPSLSGQDRALARLAMASAFNYLGRGPSMQDLLTEMVSDETSPEILRDLASAWLGLLEASQGASLRVALRAMSSFGVTAEQQGLTLYAGTAFHNCAGFELNLGHPHAAAEFEYRALANLSEAEASADVSASAYIGLAMARFELGEWDRCDEALAMATEHAGAQPDVYAEAAMLTALRGEREVARQFLSRGRECSVALPTDVGAEALLKVAARLLAVMEPGDEGSVAISDDIAYMSDPSLVGLQAVAAVKAEFRSGRAEKRTEVIAERRRQVELQGSVRWLPVLGLLEACSTKDAVLLGGLLSRPDAAGSTLLFCAEEVACCFDILSAVPDSVGDSMVKAPRRWIDALRMAFTIGRGSPLAAECLSRLGEPADVAVLREWERHTGRKGVSFADQLVRRLTPTLRLFDLGRAYAEAGRHQVAIGKMRRRSAMLLLFLASRPGLCATRDQVADALWPDQDVEQVANNIHQTVYFLRRELDPQYGKGLTADYLVVDGDLLHLDPELTQIASGAFARQAAGLLRTGTSVDDCVRGLADYRGRFASDFEYEPWADAWRANVHGVYLRLAEKACRGLIAGGEYDRACGVLTAILTVDPEAVELHALMAVALHFAGLRTAAAAAYARYAHRYRAEVEADPDTMEDLLEEQAQYRRS